jgi:hypothetical protein
MLIYRTQKSKIAQTTFDTRVQGSGQRFKLNQANAPIIAVAAIEAMEIVMSGQQAS